MLFRWLISCSPFPPQELTLLPAREPALPMDGTGDREAGGGTKQLKTRASVRCTRPFRGLDLGKAMILHPAAPAPQDGWMAPLPGRSADMKMACAVPVTDAAKHAEFLALHLPARVVHLAGQSPGLARHEEWSAGRRLRLHQ